jgi:hypothetical protein
MIVSFSLTFPSGEKAYPPFLEIKGFYWTFHCSDYIFGLNFKGVVTCFYANDTNSLQNRMENVPLQESLPEH